MKEIMRAVKCISIKKFCMSNKMDLKSNCDFSNILTYLSSSF